MWARFVRMGHIYVFVYVRYIYSVYMSNSSYFLHCPAFHYVPCCCTLMVQLYRHMAFSAIALPVDLLIPLSTRSGIPTSWTLILLFMSGMDIT